ncbi:hypothetical protein RAS12_13200 [Achromobacter seleniivolatilans]|uniref:Uncharacterized protein n=1 Tax=Achromobacter seleniivolatilans TaxID=3047478 RepID=A0ABY9MBW4_9BURK|nr:hypothetical protein [Achromobacter sp. R39]WMD23282.1 hypothetical protein RAS12_13200 [Achromobacter sp. R39]
MTKTSYSKTLEALMVSAQVRARANKFIAIYTTTEDLDLRIQLDSAIKLLSSNEYTQGVAPTSAGDRLNLDHPQWKPLRSFCEDAIASQKPEWQVIAERHGWQPAAT